MMIFVGIIGLFFMMIRSDLLLKYRYFNEAQPVSTVQSSENNEASYHQPAFLLLVGEDQPQLVKTLENNLTQMGKKVKTRPINENFTTSTEYEGIIIATEKIDDLPDIQSLLSYVETGGSIFFAIRPSPGSGLASLYQQIGMVEMGAFIETSGIELTEPFFTSSEGQSFPSDDIRNSSLSARIGKQASLIAQSSDGTPLLWSSKYGDGKFVFFNGTILADASQSALFTKGIQLMVPTFIYPVVNAKVTALEGFPFQTNNNIHKDSGMTNENFMRHVVWSELQRLEAKYDLNYTASFVAANDEMKAEKQAFELDRVRENTIVYGRELLRMGGELALQGYTNAPIEGLEVSAVKQQMTMTSDQLEQSLPGYEIKTYIPVKQSDHLTHYTVIKDVYPDLQTIMTDVEKPSLFDQNTAVLPRQLQGFQVDSYSKWLAYNGLFTTGFLSHAVTPQLLLQDEDVDDYLQQFSELQSNLKKDVPWLRYVKVSDTLDDVQNYVENIVTEEHTNDEITFHLNKLNAPAYFFFSSEKPVSSVENGKITNVGQNLYLIETNQLTFTIRLE